MLTQREKLKKAIELLKKGTPIREIGKELRLSHSTICLIKKKMALHINDEKEKSSTEISEIQSTKDDSSMTAAAVYIKKDMSKHSQGLKLLMEKKSLVEISILLDLETDDALKIFNDFLILQKMEKVVAILIENKNNLDAFISLQSRIARNNIDVRKVWPKPQLEQENFNLKEDNKTLKFEKETAQDITEFWKEQFIKVNGKYQYILKLAKRKGLMPVKHTTNRINTHF